MLNVSFQCMLCYNVSVVYNVCCSLCAFVFLMCVCECLCSMYAFNVFNVCVNVRFQRIVNVCVCQCVLFHVSFKCLCVQCMFCNVCVCSMYVCSMFVSMYALFQCWFSRYAPMYVSMIVFNVVFAMYAFNVCFQCMFVFNACAQCMFSMHVVQCLLSMYVVYVFNVCWCSMYAFDVSVQCMFSMYLFNDCVPIYVFNVCVFNAWFQCMCFKVCWFFNICVQCMRVVNVWFQCMCSMYMFSVRFNVCVQCMRLMHVFNVCVQCMFCQGMCSM